MVDYDVMIYIDGVYVAQGTSYDYSHKPSGDKKETFEGVKNTSGPTEIEVKISKIDIKDTSYPALRNKVLNEINGKENAEITIVDIDEAVTFTGVKYSDFSVKRDPKSKEIEMGFTAEDSDFEDL